MDLAGAGHAPVAASGGAKMDVLRRRPRRWQPLDGVTAPRLEHHNLRPPTSDLNACASVSIGGNVS